MKSNYKRIGDYIQLVDERNRGLKITKLLGLSISKEFIPSVANIIGTDMSNYKIIRKNQFACSTMQVRRDKKMPIALLKDFDEAIISQAYPVFEVIDTDKLLPDYLMMWFTRSEFDRQACFHAVGGVRGSLEWEDFLNLEFPIPSIEKQQEIVKEYKTIVNRIALNETLNHKLEETAQALYKHWFVDFEFSNKDGKPYKSSGGEMIYNEELDKDIPVGWEDGNLIDLMEIIDGDRGGNYPSQENFNNDGYCLFLNAGNVTKIGFEFSSKNFITQKRDELLRKGKLIRKDIVLTTRGTVGNVAYYSDEIEFSNIRINSGMVILRAIKGKSNSTYCYSLMRSSLMKSTIENYVSGSAQPQLPIKDMKLMPILLPEYNRIKECEKDLKPIQAQIDILNNQNRKLVDFAQIILSKMTKVETEKEVVS